MKKKILYLLLITAIATVFGFSLVACKTVDASISFMVDGELYGISSTDGEEEIIFPKSPEKEGYTFGGWYFDNGVWARELTANTSLDVSSSEGFTVYARWIPNTEDGNKTSYTITFDSNGGTDVNAITQIGGTTITEPSNPTKAGYSFGGWYTDNATFNHLYTFSTMPEENIDLYAKWTPTTLESIYDLRYETDETFEVNSLKSVRYTFDVTDFLVFDLLMVSDNPFNAVLMGSEGEIKSYQTDRVSDSLLLENGDYSLVISKHEQDTAVTTNISHQEIITGGEVNLSEEHSLRLLSFDITEEYNYIVVLSTPSDDILYDVYDADQTLLYENQKPGDALDLESGEYYFLFYGVASFTGRASLAKKSSATNTTIETAEPLNGSTYATGEIDVASTKLFYSFTVNSSGSLYVVRAWEYSDKSVSITVYNSEKKAMFRAGLNFSGLSSDANFGGEAKGEYVLPAGTYYVQVGLSGGNTGTFNVSVAQPSVIDTYAKATHSLSVSSNTTYYFRVFVAAGTRIYFNTYYDGNPDRYFPLCSLTKEENGIRHYARAYGASMFTGENYFHGSQGNMDLGISSAKSTDKYNFEVASKYSDKDDYYYVCIKAFHNADGGYMSIKVEENSPK